MSQSLNGSRPRVLIADDHAMFAETLREFLAAKYDVVGPVADGAALLLAATELTPDLAVVDIGLTLPNGLNASCQLRQKFPSIKLVCMTQQREPTMVAEVFRRGASAFLVKSSPVAELLTAIEEALLERVYISPSVANKVVSDLLHPYRRKDSEVRLTARQREVLRLLAEGKSMKFIGEALGISARTVQFHKYEMMKNLRLKTNAGIIQYAIHHGIISA